MERVCLSSSLDPLNAYVKSKFRDSRDEQGQLSFRGGNDRIKIIEEMSVYDLERCELVKIKDLGELI
jgi:hypothetical protein